MATDTNGRAYLTWEKLALGAIGLLMTILIGVSGGVWSMIRTHDDRTQGALRDLERRVLILEITRAEKVAVP